MSSPDAGPGGVLTGLRPGHVQVGHVWRRIAFETGVRFGEQRVRALGEPHERIAFTGVTRDSRLWPPTVIRTANVGTGWFIGANPTSNGPRLPLTGR